MQNTRPAARPFFSYGKIFGRLSAPVLGELVGDFEAELRGPAWFRAISRFSLNLGGLPQWYGKRFDGEGQGVNLVMPKGSVETTMPMQVRVEPSTLDGKPAAVVHYAADARFPWPHVIDELRSWEANTLLGMTLVDVAGLRRFALPFLLHRV